MKSKQRDQDLIVSFFYLTPYSVNNFLHWPWFGSKKVPIWAKLMKYVLNYRCLLDAGWEPHNTTYISVWKLRKEKFQTSTFFSQFFSFLFSDCTTVMKPTASDVEAPSIVCCSISVRAWNIKQNAQSIHKNIKISTWNNFSDWNTMCTQSNNKWRFYSKQKITLDTEP